MRYFLAPILLIFLGQSLFAQEVTGKWENRNHEGTVNSIIEIYKEDGKYFGKVDRIMKEEDRDRVCSECDGELKDQPIEGMTFMWDLEKNGSEYSGGTIVDPKSGKEYRCKIWLDENDPDRLNVRGYLAFFYKTKVWERAE
ncbi:MULTISPECIES: DUF2147 domain-containing protein [Christiangramia]|uniref:Uncharacterized protein n=1 Tax=Christiangramia flava JLT2011 TaxID=1229726 RepID=A0A1L7I7W3_9FLAO|nr:DUF2147 domain-containing protein [Christiangramia flava]APU69708.1 hypothetical protein GRFL_2984 [Christiangramia flava JLT2011]OSS39259.1 hypothetical protein C723_1805 [Christiangramia flava JLT2011]